MRIDKYLKVSRIIKRRTVASDACVGGRVKINGTEAKPSSKVKVGDVIEITMGNRTTKVEIINIKDTTKKEEVKEMYKIV